jgi:hypothetical protein
MAVTGTPQVQGQPPDPDQEADGDEPENQQIDLHPIISRLELSGAPCNHVPVIGDIGSTHDRIFPSSLDSP